VGPRSLAGGWSPLGAFRLSPQASDLSGPGLLAALSPEAKGEGQEGSVGSQGCLEQGAVSLGLGRGAVKANPCPWKPGLWFAW